MKTVPLQSVGQVDISADGQSGNPLMPHTLFLSSGHFPQMTSFLVPMIFFVCLFDFGDKVSLHNPGWPWTCDLSCPSLPNPGITIPTYCSKLLIMILTHMPCFSSFGQALHWKLHPCPLVITIPYPQPEPRVWEITHECYRLTKLPQRIGSQIISTVVAMEMENPVLLSEDFLSVKHNNIWEIRVNLKFTDSYRSRRDPNSAYKA